MRPLAGFDAPVEKWIEFRRCPCNNWIIVVELVLGALTDPGKVLAEPAFQKGVPAWRTYFAIGHLANRVTMHDLSLCSTRAPAKYAP